MKSSLLKFLKKHGKSLGDFGEEAGKKALGGANLATKKAVKTAKYNPKATLAVLGAGGAGYALGSSDDDEPRHKRKKKKPDYLDD